MTLDEAIKHCEEVAHKQDGEGCEKCADEHRQLAEWLKELKGRRQKEQEESITDVLSKNPVAMLCVEMSQQNKSIYEAVTKLYQITGMSLDALIKLFLGGWTLEPPEPEKEKPKYSCRQWGKGKNLESYKEEQ